MNGKRQRRNQGEKSLLAACLIAVAAAGCSPRSQPVYVDVDAILREIPARPEVKVALPTPPPPMSGMTFSTRGQPQRTIRDQGEKIRTSIEQIEKTQSEAIHALNAQLKTLYAAEVARFAKDRLAKVFTDQTSAYDSSTGAIRKALLEYGAKRGPLMAALAVDVGWPDPDPNSRRNPTGLVQKKIFEKDKNIRAKIAALDAGFAAQMDAVLAQIRLKTNADLAAARTAIRDFQEQLNKKADAEAARQVRATPKQLDIQLAGARTTVLPAVPAKSVQIAPSAPNSPAPKVPLSGIGNGLEDRRRMVEQELRSWLGLHRYTLAKPGKGVPDETQEFRAWRKTLLSDGP